LLLVAAMAQATTREVEASRHTRLLAVLLVDALETLGREPRGASAREVRRWVCGTGSDEGPFSFTSACDTLGLPSTRLRRRLGLRGQNGRRCSARGLVRRGRAPHRPAR
jgi:hypothetical protein